MRMLAGPLFLCLLNGLGCNNQRLESQVTATPRTPQSFVQVVNGRLQVEGQPFHFTGSNVHRLALAEAFQSQIIRENKEGRATYPGIDRALEHYAATGYKVIRLWGFSCEGAKGSQVTPPFINKDLSLNMDGIQPLDYTIARAGQHGLRVILPLVNHEPESCGMDWWVEHALVKTGGTDKRKITWSCVATRQNQVLKLTYNPDECQALQRPDQPVEAIVTREAFYFDETVKSAFKNHVQKFLTRINPYTGLSYRDDPAILAVELSNKARTADYYECLSTGVGQKTFQSCAAENPATYKAGELVYNWLADMSEFVRSVDARHLITTGEEGFRSSHQDPGCLQKHAWIHNGMKGVDFARNATLPHISFMTTHLHPEDWSIPTTDLNWLQRCVIKDRAALAARHGKPIILEEAGFSGEAQDRTYLLSRLFRDVNKAGFQGTMAEDDPAEQLALKQQISCQQNLVRGQPLSRCVGICPRGTTVDATGHGVDPQGSRCVLPLL
ncbi:hypothetical protein [Oligoflexus tunisiensis]|uniref:hypothetical protein n=1 Tax=Oligoflexus tunisiensis TaxID=708132 RepID=UPI000B233850|nr:hypothetical protein [Oligoflexus tunisiensis]